MKLSMKVIIVVAAVFMFACGSSRNGQMTRKALQATVEQNFRDAAVQYHYLKDHVPPGKFPKNWSPQTNSYEWSGSEWWCSGFYPGSLFMIYEKTGDTSLYAEANRMLTLLKKEQYNKGTHDLGFMMYCSFGQANRLHHDPAYDSILLNSARSLSTRFNPKVGCIKSWDSRPSEFLVIIDNMMNLELLFWATRFTGDSSFYKIAVTHANTTIRNHFRGDYSSYHVVNYDPNNGTVLQKRTAQGYSNESAWARGQAWGLYGFTVMYRETKDKKYLDQAIHIADFILGNRNLPDDKVPYWDFNAPDIPNALRDASAAAIVSSALFELSDYAGRTRSGAYRSIAEHILTTLSGNEYKAANNSNGGFLLKHSVGHLPNKTEVNVGITYADYYFLEAMKRYQSGSY